MGVLLQRSFSTVVLLGLLAGALWWDCELGYYGLVCIFCILASWEWRHMLLRSGKASQPNLSFLFGVAYPVLLSWSCCITKFRESALAEQVSFLIPLPLLVALAAPVLLVVVAFIREMKHPVDGSRALRSVGTTLLSFIYPVWLFSFAILALHLAYMRAGYVYPAIVMCVLWVVLVTKMADIFAYVSGFLLGGRLFSRRLIPHISPKKTWEGLLGSWVLTNAAAIGLVFPMFRISVLSITQVLVLMGCTSLIFLLSVYGDLAGSLVKRSLAIKDSGSLLPGIGGIFDLIDSPSFTVPFFWFLLACIG
ncbi:MAG: phosphatidate cytidylyltransferase [Akkermansia muciniphila]|uniref:phosphatidate cytidylyltransferase n=2 Tax=Akkermansiaceae TaxID=1647988 RepID=UPI001C05FA8C|nr:phosphatidate cytidylyltransferase [Akkermansia muciniphila]MCI9205120.1 phosphatidate cytidylyltransferase [Akkermansia muciniphila]QWP43313.1 phosphatidate cytidylyltransferase [Akkermansia muciniphila]